MTYADLKRLAARINVPPPPPPGIMVTPPPWPDTADGLALMMAAAARGAALEMAGMCTEHDPYMVQLMAALTQERDALGLGQGGFHAAVQLGAGRLICGGPLPNT